MLDASDIATIAFCIAVANKHGAPNDYVAQVVDAYKEHTNPAPTVEALPPII